MALISKMARVGPEESPAMQTLALTPLLSVECFHPTMIGNDRAQTKENSNGEEDGKKMIQGNLFEANEEEENQHFQTG